MYVVTLPITHCCLGRWWTFCSCSTGLTLTILYNVCSDIAHYTLLFRTLVDFLQLLYRAYSDLFFTYLEINPLGEVLYL